MPLLFLCLGAALLLVRQARFVFQPRNVGVVLHGNSRPLPQIGVYRVDTPSQRFKTRVHVARQRFDASAKTGQRRLIADKCRDHRKCRYRRRYHC